jgi:sensor histidine kinase YesM
MMIQPFVENAIVHGLIHKKTDRKLDIKLLTDQNKIVCHIIDNGIGREAAEKIRSKKNLSYKSVGIQLTKQRFAIQNALRKERSFCSISDLVDEAGNPIGTHVTLTFDRTN